MGCNYDWVRYSERCPTCGHQTTFERIHIGKSSAGWTFGFHAVEYGDLKLISWKAWREKLLDGTGHIEDEYGHSIRPDEFEALVEAKQTEKHNHAREYSTIDRSFLDPEGYSFTPGEFS